MGRHTAAPRSIRAWLKSPGRSWGMVSAMACRNAARTFVSSTLRLSPVSRAATRSTLPSTAGTACPKAMDRIAPAV